MKFVFLSYVNTQEFTRPEDWIQRLRGYFGVLEALSQRHQVNSIEQIDYEGEYHLNGVQYHFLNFRKKIRRWPVRLHRYVRKLHPDIVVVHGLHFPLQVIQLRQALGRSVRIIVQSHADKLPPGWKKPLQIWADRCTDAYLFTASVMAKQWIAGRLISSADKVNELMVGSSIFTPVDKATARTRTGMRGEQIFIWAGRLEANKDPFTMITAFLNFATGHPGARLYMIYQTEELADDVRQLLTECDPGQSIVLVGKVAHAEMVDWFCGADFVVSTSHAEAFGLAISEAMSCGCIPILSDIPSYRKITGEGNCGLLFAAGNAGDLQRALLEGSRMDLREEQQKVSAQFAEHLSFRAIADRLDQIGNSL